MKQVLIFIRPNMYFKTKDALTVGNFNSMSVKEVLGRGKKGANFDMTGNGKEVTSENDNPFVAKKMIEIFCRDEDVDCLIKIVLSINRTGTAGDGKIFVIPAENGIRIRTAESGVNSIV
ncbi:nitrogen fixation nifHD region glnB 2 [Clostridia bacterium]|nr:nitrogen fixation nifHD region glnB 2 [Clostridia bacterium]